MFKFTIRDMFWLTLFVGFCLHAWTERFSRDAAWYRRVREEAIDRAAAEARKEEAETKTRIAKDSADKFARAARQFQDDLFRARHPGVPVNGDLALPPECP
ncbi:MAG TPA: hypothetical protein VFB96_04140 [Pirellulaceae bacterium]|nr:hypothetical protein [Pirellulaceae bacterium]